MNYRIRATVLLTFSLLLCLVAFNADHTSLPLWLTGLLAGSATALAVQGLRQVRLSRYYEGRRTRLVIPSPVLRSRRR